MSIRNGRFTTAGTIIQGRANLWYRILNSGDFVSDQPDTNGFTITFANGAGGTVFLRPTFSVDVLVQASVVISGSEQVQGMYEAVPNTTFQSGRFRTRGAIDPSSGVEIALRGSGGSASAVYRIFNTGVNPFSVYQANFNGTNEAQIAGPLIENQSLDLTFPNSGKKILVKPDPAGAGNHIEGIYDLISDS